MVLSLDNCLNRLADASQEGQLTVFCGAGISKPSPTNLPTADDIVCNVLEQVSEAIPELRKDLLAGSYLFRGAPFELFVGVIEQGLHSRAFEILEPLTDGEPNSIHRCLASLLTSRQLNQIITTNFDNMLEQALHQYNKEFKVYYSWRDIEKINMSPGIPAILKLHGSFLDMDDNDITRTTILTTIDSIYRSSDTKTLRKWIPLLEGRTLLFLGYSGRDRIDVMRLLSFLKNVRIIWIDHSDGQLEVVNETPSISKELRELLKTGSPSITLVSGHTERFLDRLSQLIPATNRETPISSTVTAKSFGKPLTFQPIFRPQLFPKYAGLIAGYLFLWSGWAQQAGYAFRKFLELSDEPESLLFTNAIAAMGQVYELMNQPGEVEKYYTASIRSYWGLGDYPSIVTTQNYYADFLIAQGKYENADRLLFQALDLASREKDAAGIPLCRFNIGALNWERGNFKEAAKSFAEAAQIAADTGNFWIEAGALQRYVAAEYARKNRYSEKLLHHCLTVFENIYWIGGGSAPSIKLASMVDPVSIITQIADAAQDVMGTKAVAFIESNLLLSRVGQVEAVLARLRLKKKRKRGQARKERHLKYAEKWSKKGIEFGKVGEYEKALRAFSKAIDFNPDDDGAWTNKGAALNKLRRYQDALEAFDEAIRINPKNSLPWTNKGITLIEMDLYEESITALNEAIGINSNMSKAWIQKGLALVLLERYEEALEAFNEAIRINPWDSKTRWAKQNLLVGPLKRYEECLQECCEALKIDPDDSRAWCNKGISLGLLGRNQEALEALQKAVELDNEDAHAWNNLGQVLKALGRHSEAEIAIVRAKRMNK